MRNLNRKYFYITVIGVALSAFLQLGILTKMQDRTPFEQTVVLFYADIVLVLVVDKIKTYLKNNK